MKNTTVNILKYRSMNDRMPEPYTKISHPTRKKRADLLTNDAKTNTGKLILKAPADMVNTL